MGKYTSEVAIDKFFQFVELIDGDAILESAGKTRQDLQKLTYDDEVSQCMDLRLEALLSTPRKFSGDGWEIVSAEINPFLDDIIRASFNSDFYGYSVIELVYQNKDGFMGIKKAQEKPFWWFYPDQDGRLYFNETASIAYSTSILIQGNEVDTKYKFILTRNKPTYDNPRGVATLSRLYYPCHYRFHSWQFWIQFLERASAPMLVGKSSSPDNMAEQLNNAVQSATISTGISDEVSMLESSNTGESYANIEQAIVRRIQKTILGRALTADLNIGSRAAQEVEERLSDSKRLGDMRKAQRTVQKVCDAITGLNGLPPIKFEIGDFTDLRIDRAQRDKTLSDSGIMQFSDEYLMREYGFLDVDFRPIDKSLSTKMDRSSDIGVKLAVSADKNQDKIDNVISLATKQAGHPIDYDDVMRLLDESKDYEEFLAKLDAFYAPMADVGKFDEVTERAIFYADTIGYSALTEELNGDSI